MAMSRSDGRHIVDHAVADQDLPPVMLSRPATMRRAWIFHSRRADENHEFAHRLCRY